MSVDWEAAQGGAELFAIYSLARGDVDRARDEMLERARYRDNLLTWPEQRARTTAIIEYSRASR